MKHIVKYLLIILLAFFPVLMYAQAAGGQVKRPVKPQVSKPVNKRPSSPTNSNKNNAGKSSASRMNTANALSAEKLYKRGDDYYYGNGVTQNYSEAVKWYSKAADQGHADAQYNLGYLYYHGEGVSKDYAEAVKWYRKAANHGNASAQTVLGYCFFNGDGVLKDYAEAVKWYRKAADQGYSIAQTYLGNCYFDGNGVTKDYAEAAKWYRKAADQGYAKAQACLGSCYFLGDGVLKDYAEAVNWYSKAADQGVAYAQYYLGYCYYFGQGIAEDKASAKSWMEKSAANGYEEAKKFLQEKTFQTATTGSQGSTSSNTEMNLRDMLNKPMGLDFDVKTASHSTVKKLLKSKYKVDDSTRESGDYVYYVWKKDNSKCENMQYHGLPLDYCYININEESNISRKGRLLYSFEIKKSAMSNPKDPYSYLDKIMNDYHRLGINLSYEKVNESITKAKGGCKVGNLEHEIELKDNGPIWQFKLHLWIYK